MQRPRKRRPCAASPARHPCGRCTRSVAPPPVEAPRGHCDSRATGLAAGGGGPCTPVGPGRLAAFLAGRSIQPTQRGCSARAA
eukprot:1997763-Alexandrium_andersonii.AAC.1